VHGGGAHLVHHGHRGHAGPAARAVEGQHVDLGLGRRLHGEGHDLRPVGACLQEDVLGPLGPQVLDVLHEGLVVRESHAGVPLEALERAGLERLLHVLVLRVWKHQVSALLQLQRALQGGQSDLAADGLGPLSPLPLDDVHLQLAEGILIDSSALVLHVGLHGDASVLSVVELLVGLDPEGQVRGAGDLSLGVHGLGVHPADVLAHGLDDSAHGRTLGHRLPVALGYGGGAEPSDDQRHLQPYRLLGAGGHGAGDVNVLEEGLVGGRIDAIGTDQLGHYLEVRPVQVELLVGGGGALAEVFRHRVQYLSPPEGGLTDLA